MGANVGTPAVLSIWNTAQNFLSYRLRSPRGHGKKPAKLGLITKVDPGERTRLFCCPEKKLDHTELVALAEPIVRSFGCDIVLLTFQRGKDGHLLRLFVEKEGSDPFVGSGVDHAVCAGISHRLGDLLETNEDVPPFLLEVSSPGIERPLVKPADYVRFAGRRVRIRTKEAVAGQKNHQGVLLGVQDELVRVELETGGITVDIPMASIGKANLIFDMNVPKRKSGEK